MFGNIFVAIMSHLITEGGAVRTGRTTQHCMTGEYSKYFSSAVQSVSTAAQYLQRNVLTEPVPVDLGMYINLSSGTNDPMSLNLSETRTKIGTASLDIKGKRTDLRGKKKNLCKGRQ
jgi:hypothetical protein